ncbi:hypothetical protein EW145_g1911 [Phellinidium pouzarii]|uniref:Uncharacterized protein n=1 Tax=Phellinidium pouzarii TaxID=167371 RepID=A0A4S4LI87_9AGAM|nr:hypothetical protein EW145_g1911 [Phellinidium pouzarii]
MITLTVVSLLLSALSFILPAAAEPCIAMDASFNLLVFGVGGKDFNAGTQDSWTGSSATDITASGRPPFDGSNTTCYLAQFFNAIYVLNADSSDSTSVYIYNPTGKSWSKQPVTTPSGSPSFDPTDFKAILDHDTNVFYALSKGELFFLDMGALTAANSTALTWTDVGAPVAWGDLSTYQPVMALAQNHIHFIGVQGLTAGECDIFVIHFSFFQPAAQSYSSNFPESHGQAVSFFQKSDVQQEFAYIPDDGSATYVINVESNTTQTLAGPSVKDSSAQYFAGITSLVQLSSANSALSFLAYTEGSDNSAAAWTKITAVTLSTSSSNTSSTSVLGSGSSGTKTGSSPSATASTSDAGRTVMNTFGLVAGTMTLATFMI